MSLLRRLRILYPEDARPLVEPPVVTDSVTSERYHGSDYDVRGECERDIVLTMQVPKDEAWTVRRGSLFELDLVLRVEAECGFLQCVISTSISCERLEADAHNAPHLGNLSLWRFRSGSRTLSRCPTVPTASPRTNAHVSPHRHRNNLLRPWLTAFRA